MGFGAPTNVHIEYGAHMPTCEVTGTDDSFPPPRYHRGKLFHSNTAKHYPTAAELAQQKGGKGSSVVPGKPSPPQPVTSLKLKLPSAELAPEGPATHPGHSVRSHGGESAEQKEYQISLCRLETFLRKRRLCLDNFMPSRPTYNIPGACFGDSGYGLILTQ